MTKKQLKPKSTLTLAKINKETKSFSETHLFEFSNGETLNINIRFKPSAIEDMLEEYGQHMNTFEDHMSEMTETKKQKFQVYFLHFLVIKHFTDLKKSITDDSSKILDQFNAIIDTIYFQELIDNGFLTEEINKVWEKASKLTAAYSFMNNLEHKFQKHVQNLELENKDVLEKFGKDKQVPEM
ncbi:hypothetical protein P4V41_07135 [Fictibacillus nanhaiensis]|uniref:hypothetical protein n=1 Tax=Fictibacillus nanhaiensis TaxID=742169 RepID=UPI002E239F59|nr:hypothetical protein [Fictibacillus nanhaiensis]